jgi:hypothetical protein
VCFRNLCVCSVFTILLSDHRANKISKAGSFVAAAETKESRAYTLQLIGLFPVRAGVSPTKVRLRATMVVALVVVLRTSRTVVYFSVDDQVAIILCRGIAAGIPAKHYLNRCRESVALCIQDQFAWMLAELRLATSISKLPEKQLGLIMDRV